MRLINFSPGPSAIPLTVLSELQSAILEYKDSGVGICELGHRTKYFNEIIDEAKSLLTELIGLSSDFEVIFMTGGATAQFAAVPLNFLNQGQSGCHLVSGHWAKAAFEEAERLGEIVNVGSSESDGYKFLPKVGELPANAAYLHITSNNTIYGTQIKNFPETKVPLICDSSSDFLSRRIDPNKFSVIYAGAQKLVGTSGVTIVLINKNHLPEVKTQIPKTLDYREYITYNSLFNTPPVFSIYSTLLTLRWLKAQGGLAKIEEKSAKKSKLLYDFLDSSALFAPYVPAAHKEDRSQMNVVFYLKQSGQEAKVVENAKKAGIIGIEGYRSVGGFRVSLYNAVEVEDVKKLVDVLADFDVKSS